ncbi:MAG TPA: hypothetical protein VFW64_12465 [Pseudonocardiaceae bacterium]|nr:hypothetical protein [Pseudonocardiaceae bacterium]
MKRSPMPARVKPLERRTPLNPSGAPLRRTPLAAVSVRRKRDNARRTRVVSAMRHAAEGRCARCGRAGLPVFGHERIARAHGGSLLHPDCVLCNGCNGWCEDRPQVAAWTGWKVSGKWPHDPALEPWEARDLVGNIIDFRILVGAA